MSENTFQSFTYPEADGFGQLKFDGENAGKPVILVTNDDGWQSKGIKALVESLKGKGIIVVCAPDSPRSGFGASFTCTKPVSLERIYPTGKDAEDEIWYSCSGTPVDCVKLAMHRLFSEKKPDLVVSGVNHGSNDSICIMYSGTMGATLEGSVVGIPSIGFSLLDHRPEADFTYAKPWISKIVDRVMADANLLKVMSNGLALNVNIPVGDGIQGVRVCRQANGVWEDEFHYLEGNENEGKAMFQVTGFYRNREPEATDTDQYWLSKNYISIVPVNADYTDHNRLESLRILDFAKQ